MIAGFKAEDMLTRHFKFELWKNENQSPSFLSFQNTKRGAIHCPFGPQGV